MNKTEIMTVTKPDDMASSRRWVGVFISGPSSLPISFVLDGMDC